MKQFKFQNKASVITGIKEEQPRRRSNIDRIIYLIIFILLITSLIIYLIRRNVSASALGEVITGRFDVMEMNDMKIMEYFVNEGDTVKAGDTLFRYRTEFFDDDNELNATISLSDGEGTSNWLLREISLTKRNIQLKQIDISDVKQRISKTQDLIEKMKLEVYLDVYPPVVLKQQKMLLDDYRIDLTKLNQELSQLYIYLRQLEELQKQQLSANVSISGSSMGAGGQQRIDYYYISPVNGIISKINTPLRGITYKKEAALFISNLDKIFIKAYIPQENLEYFRLNDIVELSFMDGSRSKGIIKDIYLITEEVPEEFRAIRGKNQRTVIAEVYPFDELERERWITYYQFTVKLTISKL